MIDTNRIAALVAIAIGVSAVWLSCQRREASRMERARQIEELQRKVDALKE